VIPVAPLLAATDQGVRSLARRLGIDPSLLCRPLTPHQADRYAVRCGFHPLELWGPDEFYAGVEDDIAEDGEPVPAT